MCEPALNGLMHLPRGVPTLLCARMLNLAQHSPQQLSTGIQVSLVKAPGFQVVRQIIERRQDQAEMQQRQRERLKRYFGLSQEEKTRYLDEQIARMEKGRQARQANGGSAGSGRGQSGPPGSAEGAAASETGPSSRDRDKRRMDRLDSTTPEERAMFVQFRQEMSARRAQLGLPTSGGR